MRTLSEFIMCYPKTFNSYFSRSLLLILTVGFAQSVFAKPNVIVILTDDQGYADVGYQDFEASSDVLTPNLDKLAASGIRFSNGYTPFSTCGPSRASLLTGRTASRFGVEENSIYLRPVFSLRVNEYHLRSQ